MRNMEKAELIPALTNVANKLAQMWGNNPDSDLIREAVKQLEAVPEPTKTTKKGESK